MGDFVKVARIGELSDGTMKEVQAQGREFLLAMVGGKCYAANGRCPHMGGHLALGKLDGLVVTCPRHGSQFDLSDGRVVRSLKDSGVFSIIGKALKRPRILEFMRSRL
jgi:3-phenylpropionate/trans-cinnamate dioxygenase ferredoxin subunit